MLEVSYGKEAFDLRLTILRIIRQWKQILFWIAVGTILSGVGYWAKHCLFVSDVYYQAESTYRVDYGVEDVDVGLVVINAATWDTYVHSEEFLNQVAGHLSQELQAKVGATEIDSMISGKLASDWRVPSTKVLTTDKEICGAVAKAVEETMVVDFPLGISEIKAIRVIDSAGEASEVIPDVRLGRAVILGFVLSVFWVLVIYLLSEIGSDAIWLPVTLRYRYGLKVLGTEKSNELSENVKYLFAERKRVAVCPVQEDINPREVAAKLAVYDDGENREWFCVPAPGLCPGVVEKLREADGIVLSVNAGKHAGKRLEYALEYLSEQDCHVTAAILVNADEHLIRWYYGFGRCEQEDVRKD